MKLKEYGSELIEVADDGTGVLKDDLEGLASKHHTSKFTNIEDLQVCVSGRDMHAHLSQSEIQMTHVEVFWLADTLQLWLQGRGPELPLCSLRAYGHNPHSTGCGRQQGCV